MHVGPWFFVIIGKHVVVDLDTPRHHMSMPTGPLAD